MTEEVKKTKVDLDMPCICRDEGEEDAAKRREKVSKFLELDDQTMFVSVAIASLWHDFQCTIDGIYMDMWYGISASNQTETFFLACDLVEDGLASILEYHIDNRKREE